jgi:hypothetical protein
MRPIYVFSIIWLVLAVAGCSSIPSERKISKVPNIEEAVKAVTTTGVTGQSKSVNTGKTYRYFQTDDPGAQASTRIARIADREAVFSEADVSFDDTSVFKGHARANAKTTVAHAKLEKFRDLDSLLKTIPSDETMLSYEPRITRDTPRVSEELRNVAVCAWIVATKREDDNDYHIMISNEDRSIIFNAEMSGIPTDGSKSNRMKIFKAREMFESFVEQDGRRTGNYTGWGDAVPVYMEGSLFYDTEHRPGAVGPAFARPKSAWEIHPISKILFEPDESLCN